MNGSEKTLKEKYLFLPQHRGLQRGLLRIRRCVFTGCAPAAYVVCNSNPQTALGSVVTRIPCVTDFDQDPTLVINDGDWIRVDAETGTVEVIKK